MEANLSATGFWKIANNGDEYHGDLYINKQFGRIILNIRIPYNGRRLSYLEIPLEIPFIIGTTINGAQITLLNCSRINTTSRFGSEDIYSYDVKFMLDEISFEKEDDIIFNKLTVSIPGIIQWGDITNYEPGAKDVLIGLRATEPIEIFSCTDYRLSYYLTYDTPYHLMKEEIVLNQTPFIIIETENLYSLEWFLSIANQIKRLIEIAIGNPLNFDTMILNKPDFYFLIDNGKKNYLPINVIHEKNKKTNSERIHKHNYLFDLSELRNANFKKWHEISEIMEPIVELYINNLYGINLSASRYFLNMIQALETYHARRITNSLPEFKKRVDGIVAIRHESIREDDRNVLLRGSKHNISLSSRLTDLMLAKYRFNFYTCEFTLEEFVRKTVKTRNYYTHYDLNLEAVSFKGSDLRDASHILRCILEFYILKEFGFTEEYIHEKIRNRINPLRDSHDIRKADKLRNNQ